MTIKPVVLVVDPGRNLGVIAWPYDVFRACGPLHNFNSTLISSKEKDWDTCCTDITSRLLTWLSANEYGVYKIYIEQPKTMGGAAGIAATQRNDILKLSYLIGVVRASLRTAEYEGVDVCRWKGQLPKTETERRLKRILPEKYWFKSNHLWDAYGISAYLMGRF